MITYVFLMFRTSCLESHFVGAMVRQRRGKDGLTSPQKGTTSMDSKNYIGMDMHKESISIAGTIT